MTSSKSRASSRAFLLLLAWAAFTGRATAGNSEQDGPRKKYALLIGVQAYPSLPPHRQLHGARNDVELMQRVLLDKRFGFSQDGIVSLVDEQASGAAIRRELDRLASRVAEQPPDSVVQAVVYFSGHGAQVADQAAGDPQHDEVDGYDETLVPYDADRLGGERDIRDDELHAALQQICHAGQVRVWVILDCCHSGTGARGTTQVRQFVRGDVGLPQQVDISTLVHNPLPPGAVILSACRAAELEPEFQDGNRHYGLMTRFLAQVLLEERSLNSLSYDLLRQAIVHRYRRDRRVIDRPTPQLEGELLDEIVLGFSTVPDRPAYFEVERNSREGALLRAGALHGITVGSIYELFAEPALASSGGTSSAWLRIEEAQADQATGRCVRPDDQSPGHFTEVSWPREFVRGVAVERRHQMQDAGLRVRVVRRLDAETDGPPLAANDASLPSAVAQVMADAHFPGERLWLQLIQDESEPCDVLLRIAGDQAALFPATGVSAAAIGAAGPSADSSLRGGWGPIELANSADAADRLRAFLRRIARTRNLISLAAERSGRPSDLQASLSLVTVQLDAQNRIKSWDACQQDKEGLIKVNPNAVYALHLENFGGQSVYVTVLLYGPNLGLKLMLPPQRGSGLADEQRLAKGATRLSNPFRFDEPGGLGGAVLLATRGPHDFAFLPQPDLPAYRGSFAAKGNLVPSSGSLVLADLLVEEQYFQTRGGEGVPIHEDSWNAAALEWRMCK